MITSYLTHPDFARHDMGGSHPEAPVRLEVIRKRLMLSGLLQQTMQSEAPPAKPLALARVHAPDYLETLACQRPQNGLQTLDNDTRMGPWTLEAAALAAGAAIKGVDLVCGNRADNVFCAVRPPGHHAERAMAMGFCFYNNVAVAAAHARAMHGLERIAILDFDVHQGNGTLDIFHDDPNVLICSSYQEAFYPWRYLEGDWPNVVNTALPAGTAAVTSAWQSSVTGCRRWSAIARSWCCSPAASMPTAKIHWENWRWSTAISTGSPTWRWISPVAMPGASWCRYSRAAITPRRCR